MNAEAALSGIKVVQGEGRHAVAVCAGLLARLGAEVGRDVRAGAHVYVGGRDGRMPAAAAVRCFISATGTLRHPSIAADDPEIVMQALGGLMASSGAADGPPQRVMAPVLEIFGALDAAAAVVAALRVVEAGGPEQDIDASVWDTNASLLGTFVAQATAGKNEGYREGARHSICAPWNAYAASDGFVMICTSSDALWKKLLGLMGETQQAADPRFIDMNARRANIAAVDALVEAWTRTRRVADLSAMLKKSGVPAGAIATGPGDKAAALPFVLTATGRAGRITRHAKAGASTAPLAGIRVVEIGPFTAGPITGRSLSDLGADVVKIEPPGGEVSRGWSPRAGHVSGYFAHYNTGKRSVVLDLALDGDRAVLDTLLGHADVLVQNLKAGALDKLGFGVDAVAKRHPQLIYCSISGYGHHGAQDAALDTVIQAESGIMTRVGDGAEPCKVGFSIADLLSGHAAVLGILAALRLRDRTGYAHHVDVSMLAALQWLIAQGADYPAANFAGDVVRNEQGRWVLRRDGAGDVAIRDLGDVLADETLGARGMLRRIRCSGDAYANVLGVPYPLTLTPPVPGAMIGEAGADRDGVLQEWAKHSAAHGELA